MAGITERDALAGRLAVHMRAKLYRDKHKGNWRGLSTAYLMGRALEEIGELQAAIRDGASPEDVWKEAADVANFLAMVADGYENGH